MQHRSKRKQNNRLARALSCGLLAATAACTVIVNTSVPDDGTGGRSTTSKGGATGASAHSGGRGNVSHGGASPMAGEAGAFAAGGVGGAGGTSGAAAEGGALPGATGGVIGQAFGGSGGITPNAGATGVGGSNLAGRGSAGNGASGNGAGGARGGDPSVGGAPSAGGAPAGSGGSAPSSGGSPGTGGTIANSGGAPGTGGAPICNDLPASIAPSSLIVNSLSGDWRSPNRLQIGGSKGAPIAPTTFADTQNCLCVSGHIAAPSSEGAEWADVAIQLPTAVSLKTLSFTLVGNIAQMGVYPKLVNAGSAKYCHRVDALQNPNTPQKFTFAVETFETGECGYGHPPASTSGELIDYVVFQVNSANDPLDFAFCILALTVE